jgi:hypothetical protein
VNDDSSDPHSGPLGTVIGILVVIMLTGSAILWHNSGSTLTAPASWLMTPVSHTFFKAAMVTVLLGMLVFACTVAFLQRRGDDFLPAAEEAPQSTGRTDTGRRLRVAPLAMDPSAPPTAPIPMPPDPFDGDGT